MSAQPIEWVLVVRYLPSTHKATYGRFAGSTYTKDYIQLSRKPDFIADLEAAFPGLAGGDPSVPVVFKWPNGSANGTVFGESSDRPHLTWETRDGAPLPWRMAIAPTSNSPETIRGNPSHRNAADADREYAQLMASGFGQPFLVALKLRNEADTLHLRVLIEGPEPAFAGADLRRSPQEIQDLAAATSPNSALASRFLEANRSGGDVFFDPGRKHDPWGARDVDLPERGLAGREPIKGMEAVSPSNPGDDAFAEALAYSDEEVLSFEKNLEVGDFSVPDTFATTKTRGSAQKAFANKVKDNYGWRCALTGVSTREFLIASHIVPWGLDESIRLDPSNGICFSVLVDRAFEGGFLSVQDDLRVTVNTEKLAADAELQAILRDYDGRRLASPKAQPPTVDYLRRRRAL